jgi:hypothetical protein
MALKVRRITEGKIVKGRFVPNVNKKNPKPRRKPNRKRKAAKKKK